MKGIILGIQPDVRIVDITHLISPHNIDQAAFVLKHACAHFPDGTIHIAIVDPAVGTERTALLVLADRQTFLAPDNGLLKYIFDLHPDAVGYRLTNEDYFLKPVSKTFHGKDIFAPVAAYLASGVRPEVLGERFDGFIRAVVKHPVIKTGKITGEILYLDGFGNAVTNIEAADVESFEKTEFHVKRFVIHGIHRTYAERDKGKSLALIGSHGNVEIAVNQGSAENVMRLCAGDSVTVLLK